MGYIKGFKGKLIPVKCNKGSTVNTVGFLGLIKGRDTRLEGGVRLEVSVATAGQFKVPGSCMCCYSALCDLF